MCAYLNTFMRQIFFKNKNIKKIKIKTKEHNNRQNLNTEYVNTNKER
jgi:hypothetical protein